VTDEIASFKVTAADIQEQVKPPSGDGHMTPAAIFAYWTSDVQCYSSNIRNQITV